MPAENLELTAQTPMLRQYQEIKNQHRDAILMYRIGDFYEMFYDDAVVASKTLEIVLTSRNKNDPDPVPLCGVPYHSVEPYITKLVQSGHKVAVCDQVEDPRLAKGIVRREVTRVITPGLVLNPSEEKSSSYLAALFPGEKLWGLALLEYSTGDFLAASLQPEEVLQEMRSRLIPELLLPEGVDEEFLKNQVPLRLNRLPGWVFERENSRKNVLNQFGVKTLSGFDCEEIPEGVSAAGAILHYVRETQKVSVLPHITGLKRFQNKERLLFSEGTRQSLDLDWLVQHLDRTKTAMGGRGLRRWLNEPLTDREKIEERLDAVDELLKKDSLARKAREILGQVYDLERIASRLALKTAHARDLISLQGSLASLASLQPLLTEFQSKRINTLAQMWDPLPEVTQRIEATLEGELIRSGVSTDLDQLREIGSIAKDHLARLEQLERERTGISSLKVRFNRVFGYYIEVTRTHLDKIPPEYIRKQTLTNAERFMTPELKEFEGKILGAEEKSRALEYEIFENLRNDITREIPRLQKMAAVATELDILLSFAVVSGEERYVRPVLAERPVLKIEGGRHPLVEKHLPLGQFVPNDLEIDPEGQLFLLITGPNMAGKSTFIRQAGLIVIMAQAGCFVPAKRAEIGIVDRLFSRIGASDRLNSGESTFMVEMSETASILHYATDRSLILLDEIGRGTSTFDGMSIAWAVSEYIHNEIRARTLFATHYHELIDLSKTLARLKNYNVAVRDEGGEITFLYRVEPGGMSHSYGIHVAELAGLPKNVLVRAKEVLQKLENQNS